MAGIFGSKTKTQNISKTQDKPEHVTSPETAEISQSHLVFSAANSVGSVRSHNEDSLFCTSFYTVDLHGMQEVGLFAIADGMGGHMSGEIASSAAIRTSTDYLIRHLANNLGVHDLVGNSDRLNSLVNEAFMQSQEEVLKVAPGGGTTLTIALIINNQVYFGHVGDSRLYRVNKSQQMHCMTSDHSLVRRLYELGQISLDEISDHPQKNVLIRALGQTDGFKVDQGQFLLNSGDRLLLCSDGLWVLVPDQQIYMMTLTAGMFSEACRLMVKSANDAGGQDNISVILVEYQ